MSDDQYARNVDSLAEMHEAPDGFRFVLLHPANCGRFTYNVRHLFPNFIRILQESRSADLVHAGRDFPTSLFNFLGACSAVIHRKPLIFVVDIDNRPSGEMAYRAGLESRRSYLLDKYLYTPLVNAQIRFASRFARLLLVKGEALATDFGNGRATTKTMLDVVHSSTMIIGDEALRVKSIRQDRRDQPLRVVYFGRLVPYKGLDHAIRTIGQCRRLGHDICLHIIGNGPESNRLAEQMKEAGLGDAVQMSPALPYRELLARLPEFDVLLATPLRADTPRSVFDAMSQGLPTVAYSTPYYDDLAVSGAVLTSTWNDPDALAGPLIDLHLNRSKLHEMSANAVRFARENTQEIWIRRRVEWTELACYPSGRRAEVTRDPG